MRLTVDTDIAHEKALIVGERALPFLKALHDRLKEYDMHVTTAGALPYSFKDVAYMFLALDAYTTGEVRQIFQSGTKTLIITPHKKVLDEWTQLISQNQAHHVRVVGLSLRNSHEETLDRTLWFMLSQSSERSLNMLPALEPTRPSSVRFARKKLSIRLTRKRLVGAAILGLVLLHSFFIVPLAGAAATTYMAGMKLRAQRIDAAQSDIATAKTLYGFAKGAYVLARPGLRFLLVSVYTDNFMSIQENALVVVETSAGAAENARALMSLILATHKDAVQIQDARARAKALAAQIVTIEKSAQLMHDIMTYPIKSVQEARKQLGEVAAAMRAGGPIVAHLDALLADNTEKKYVVFFYNNMEIRPGGGFIGSFAVVTFADYTLKDFEVYDVYDADGQLKTHVRPPAPIRDYLDQPHWFLRDSNFSPDFQQNVTSAEFFLDREIGLKDIDGAVGITTTALTYMLEAFGDVRVPDYDETVSADNFYLTAQSHAESGFFPGSKQKKGFLSAVGQTLMLSLEQADTGLLATALRRGLDEKHIVMHMKDPEVQEAIEKLGWSGKIVYPQCVSSIESCIINHILPVDANLGVNKANFFASRSMRLLSTLQSNGTIDNTLSISFANASPPNVFPGGTYKNYFQTYIPHDAQVSRVDVDGREISYDKTETASFAIVSALLTIPPQESSVITITYSLDNTVKSGRNAYQVVLQKQIGSFNNDFTFVFSHPDDVLITDTNFASIAKNGAVHYNSTLSTNKIFVIEFVKE